MKNAELLTMTTSTFRAGAAVYALKRITEENHKGHDLFVHAEPGDVGEVLEVDEEGNPNVGWERSGGITTVSTDEIAALRASA